MARIILLVLLILHGSIPHAVASTPLLPKSEAELMEFVKGLDSKFAVCAANNMVEEKVRALAGERIGQCMMAGVNALQTAVAGNFLVTSVISAKGAMWAFGIGTAASIAGLTVLLVVGATLTAASAYACYKWDASHGEGKLLLSLKSALAPKVQEHKCPQAKSP